MALKLPRGIELRGKSIRLRFMYQGIRCTPTLKGIEATKANIKFAEQKLQSIKYEINNGSFNYTAHFPDDPKTKLFAPNRKRVTLSQALDDFLKIKETELAPSTYKSYKNKGEKYLRPLGENNRLISDFTTTDLEYWIADDLNHLSNKGINEILIIARGVFKRGCRDMKIVNPFNEIENKEIIKELPDPFSLDEIERILSAETRYTQELNMIQVAMWSGLSLSEYFALAWEDIDQDQWKLKVNRAKIDNGWKVPKTARRERVIELIDPAIEALKRQKAITYLQEPININVLARDNRTNIQETITPVFRNTNTGKVHSYSPFIRFFRDHLNKRAKVRFRGPNHCRHTFASQLLTHGVSKEWIANQMGHSSTKMIEQHYGKWIEEDVSDMAKIVSNLIQNGPSVAHSKLKKS